jgi:hypothetical protein
VSVTDGALSPRSKKKLTYQEFISYHVSQGKVCFTKEVFSWVNHRGKGPQLLIFGIQRTEKAGFMGKGLTHREKTFGLLFLLMAVIALVTMAMLAQEKGWFASQRVYFVKFAQGHNLQKGAPVKISNIEIGKVTGIGIYRGMEMVAVEITIKVPTEHADLIRQDSVATMVQSGQGGGTYLEITPGSSQYPPIEEYGTIPSRGLKILP